MITKRLRVPYVSASQGCPARSRWWTLVHVPGRELLRSEAASVALDYEIWAEKASRLRGEF